MAVLEICLSPPNGEGKLSLATGILGLTYNTNNLSVVNFALSQILRYIHSYLS